MYCGNCKWLSITEDKQRAIKHYRPLDDGEHEHICTKYSTRILHNYHHPLLPRLDICIEEKGYEEPEDSVLFKEFKKYELKDLDNKVLTINTFESEEGKLITGKDYEGNVYILHMEMYERLSTL